ncbi:MAG TPA: ion transporter [Burkholderiales bacterium]|nr:ion transporter [Burkholderiales bacterium]
MKERIQRLVEGPRFQYFIVVLIVINAIILGMETSDYLMTNFGVFLKAVDALILKVFVIEILLRLFVYRFRFFTQPWSIFDFVVVAIALIPASEAYAALRALRVLRVLRLISVVPTMRRVIEGLLSAIPGIASVSTIMLLFFYVFAVIGTHLYSDTFPQWFGTLGSTMFTLFQIMTLESWSMGIVRPVMEQHPSAWVFFVVYILVTTFTMLNLFIAVIVNAMHSSADESAKEDRLELKRALSMEIRDLEQRMAALIQKEK